MKRSTFIYLFIIFIASLGVYQYFHPTVTPKYSIIEKPQFNICLKSYNFSSFNYRGPSLISNSTDETDLVLCPGDAIGDLNGTYLVIQNCYLAMYHKDKLIWTSKQDLGITGLCATSLQKDGDLVLYKGSPGLDRETQQPTIRVVWNSQTDYHPNKTEMRVQDQQLQIIHTLQDGTQRLFFIGENIEVFEEDMGAPRQVAKQFLLKNHDNSTDPIILRRNEYMGDLNGIHLILRTNCDLHLKNNNETLWSFAAYLKPDERCSLSAQGNSIGIPKLPIPGFRFQGMNILSSNNLTILQSNITFSGDQLIVIQTLKNGSQITFYNEPGQNNGLKLKRYLRPIANNSNNLTISSKLILERMNYIGDLDGLHLILQDNCVFMLANGQKELWKLTESLAGPFMECSVEFNEDGTIVFNRPKNNYEIDERDSKVQVFGKRWYDTDIYASQLQLLLEKDMMILTLQYQNSTPRVYHGGPKTYGSWFQLLSENSSLVVKANETENRVFPEMGYIGSFDGVYVVLNKRGNWILSNKSQVIWESGRTDVCDYGFVLILTTDGNVALTYTWYAKSDNFFWSTENITTSIVKQVPLSTTELLVNNDGLWLIHHYTDGTVRKFRAQEGTNDFVLMPDENEIEVSAPSSQIYKL